MEKKDAPTWVEREGSVEGKCRLQERGRKREVWRWDTKPKLCTNEFEARDVKAAKVSSERAAAVGHAGRYYSILCESAKICAPSFGVSRRCLNASNDTSAVEAKIIITFALLVPPFCSILWGRMLSKLPALHPITYESGNVASEKSRHAKEWSKKKNQVP